MNEDMIINPEAYMNVIFEIGEKVNRYSDGVFATIIAMVMEEYCLRHTVTVREAVRMVRDMIEMLVSVVDDVNDEYGDYRGGPVG